MAYLIYQEFKLFVFVFVFGNIWCACFDSFMTFCDNLDDLQTHKIETWTEAVIGREPTNPSQFRSIDADVIRLDQFDKLTTLIIIGQIYDIKTYTFSIDPVDSKLEYLQLYGNNIKRIRYATFDAIKLRKLSLMNNNIEYLHKEAFYNCDIQTFDVSKNNLEQIEAGVFTEDSLLNSTKEIVLKYNKLEIIEPLSFPSSLEVLNLDHNKLKTFVYNVFENLCHLEELTISHNKLPSIPNVKQLKEIRIFDFSYNDILFLKIQDFNDLKNLEVLDLGHNKIAHPQVFQEFKFPQRHPSLQISLVFNRFTHLVIGNDSFRDHIVLLYGNPWNCKCWEILEKFMVDNKVKRNKCDLMHFGSGIVPYCVYYEGNDCVNTNIFIKNPNFTVSDAESFVNLTETSKSNTTCSLVPRTL